MADKKRMWTFGVLAIAAAIIVVGCSRTKTTKVDEGEVTVTGKGEKIEVKTDEGSLTITDEAMKIKTEKGEEVMINIGEDVLPDNFPQDIPVYKPSQVGASQVMGGGKNIMLNLTTPDKVETVAKFYENKLKENGWKIGRRMNLGSATIMSSTKGTKELGVTINRDEETTNISLIFSEEG